MNYKKVNKSTARKMYNHGCSITLLPCKVSESVLDGSHFWIEPITINVTKCTYELKRFDRVISEYEHYNCNVEVGYYASYYVNEEDLNKYQMCKLMC